MPKFKVTLQEVVVYVIEVEVENEDDAADAAEAAFVQNADSNAYFSHVEEREMTDIEEVQ